LGIMPRDTSTSSLILLVEPDPDTQAMYVAGLGLSGWIVDSVTDGREALAKAISYRPAAIVMETRVPGLDGFELCRLLRRDPDTLHIPILVVTGDADAKCIAAAEDAGANRVLIKPCLPHELARMIEATLSTVRDKRSARVGTAAAAPLKPMPRTHMLSRGYQRSATTTPPLSPPDLFCPRCDRQLAYQQSHVGGVSPKHSEQWDTFECPAGCGRFQYRQRTRKLRDVS
jgi:CheY-like chemotaxis protein